MAETYLDNVDTERVDNLMKQTDTNVMYFNNACTDVVKKYSEGLDNLMKDLYCECIRDKDVTIDTLERYYLELSNMIYFMQERLEQLGVYADMSDNASKEVYSKSVINQSTIKDASGKSKVTSTVMQAQADLDAQYETVVSSIYERAYKIVKGKIISAHDTCNCLRKLITTRQNEMQMSMYSPRETYNED